MDDLFTYRLEILKKELDYIDSSVRKIDDIENSIKNWAILTWAGSLSIILTKLEFYPFLLLTAIPPLVFMFIDAHWRKIQRRFFYRQGQISDYLNSNKFESEYHAKNMKFKILDPIARNAKDKPNFMRFISITKILKFPTVSWVYLGLSSISIFVYLFMAKWSPL